MNDDSIATHMYCHMLSVLLTGQKKKKKKKKKGNTVKNDALTERVRNRPEQRVTVPGGTEENPAGVYRCCRRICDRVDPLSLALKPDVI